MAEPAAPTPVVADSNENDATSPASSLEHLLVEDDLVVEEVSIDGMCGVY